MAIISDILSITPVNVDRIIRYKAMLKKAEEAVSSAYTNYPSPTALPSLACFRRTNRNRGRRA